MKTTHKSILKLAISIFFAYIAVIFFLIVSGCKKDNDVNGNDNFSLSDNYMKGTIANWDLGDGMDIKVIVNGTSDIIVAGGGEISSNGGFEFTLSNIPATNNYLGPLSDFFSGYEDCDVNMDYSNNETKRTLNEIIIAVYSGQDYIGNLYRSNRQNPDLYWYDDLEEGDIWIELMYLSMDVVVDGTILCPDADELYEEETHLNFKYGWNEFIMYCTIASSDHYKVENLSAEPKDKNIKWYFNQVDK